MLDTGSFRYVVLMDQIEDRLKDLITYLNQNSCFDLFGVELEFYRHEDLEILIPKLLGNEVKKSVGSSGSKSRKTWTEPTFFEDVSDRLSQDNVEKLRKPFTWAKERADNIGWGTRSQRGSFNPKFDHVSTKSVFSIYSDGTLYLNFAWLDEPEKTSRYAKKLGQRVREEIPAVEISSDFMNEYVNIQIDQWSSHLPKLIKIFEDVLLKSP